MVTKVGVGGNSGSRSGTVLLGMVVGLWSGGEGVGGDGDPGKGMVSASPSIFCGGFYRYPHSQA